MSSLSVPQLGKKDWSQWWNNTIVPQHLGSGLTQPVAVGSSEADLYRVRGGQTRGALQEWLDLTGTTEGLYQTGGQGYANRIGIDNDSFLDELGYTSQLPGKGIAPLVQLLSEKKVARRNQSLAKAATSTLQSGFNTFSSYRPGGAATLAGGLYQSIAQSLYGQQTNAPDLMFEYDAARAHRDRAQARTQARTGQVISGIGSILGGVIGGGGGGGGSPGGGGGGGAPQAGTGNEGWNFAAEGAVVEPQPGGTEVIVGEAGEREFIIPESKMDDVARVAGEPNVQGPQPNQQDAGQGVAGAPLSQRPMPEEQRMGAGVEPANGGLMGEAFSRELDDPGADGYSLPGAAHFASRRLGVASDVIFATLRSLEGDGPTIGGAMQNRLDDILIEDEILGSEALYG